MLAHAPEIFHHFGLSSAVLGVAMRCGGGRLCAPWDPLFGAGPGRAVRRWLAEAVWPPPPTRKNAQGAVPSDSPAEQEQRFVEAE